MASIACEQCHHQFRAEGIVHQWVGVIKKGGVNVFKWLCDGCYPRARIVRDPETMKDLYSCLCCREEL